MDSGDESCRSDYHLSSKRILAAPRDRTSDLPSSSPIHLIRLSYRGLANE